MLKDKQRLMCIDKKRDKNGRIILYKICTGTGTVFDATADEVRVLLKKPIYDFVNLKLSRDGKILEKKTVKDRFKEVIAYKI